MSVSDAVAESFIDDAWVESESGPPAVTKPQRAELGGVFVHPDACYAAALCNLAGIEKPDAVADGVGH